MRAVVAATRPTTLVAEVAAGRAPGLVPLRVEQLEKMLKDGILAEGEAVELIDGTLVRKDRASAEGTRGHTAPDMPRS